MTKATQGLNCSMRTWMALAYICLLASACGKAPSGALGPIAAAPSEEIPGFDPEASPVPPKPNPTGGPATWSHLVNTAPWTHAVHSVVVLNLAKLEKARDKEIFCPGYARASQAQRETCWVRLVSAVAQYESNFNPNSTYLESFGVWSVGLLQLSSGECSNAPTIAKLKNPVENLVCGTEKMANLIARYGYITSPDNKHGAAAYWSTLRSPYVSNGLHLGKKAEVARLAAKYREVPPVALAAHF